MAESSNDDGYCTIEANVQPIFEKEVWLACRTLRRCEFRDATSEYPLKHLRFDFIPLSPEQEAACRREIEWYRRLFRIEDCEW